MLYIWLTNNQNNPYRNGWNSFCPGTKDQCARDKQDGNHPFRQSNVSVLLHSLYRWSWSSWTCLSIQLGSGRTGFETQIIWFHVQCCFHCNTHAWDSLPELRVLEQKVDALSPAVGLFITALANQKWYLGCQRPHYLSHEWIVVSELHAGDSCVKEHSLGHPLGSKV